LLAEIVARLQGKSFAAFLHERVFSPLGMGSSLVDDDTLTPIARRAVAYAPRSPEVLRDLASVSVAVTTTSPWLRLNRNSPHYGGSGVFTSIADWMRWDANWSRPSIGGDDFVTLMHRRMRFQHDKDNDALGLVFGAREGRTMIWYSGGDLDASSYVARFPDQQATIICLSNNPRGEAETHALAAIDALIRAGLI
jgi:CubicO group peptidase (beta-lactamase class C family)